MIYIDKVCNSMHILGTEIMQHINRHHPWSVFDTPGSDAHTTMQMSDITRWIPFCEAEHAHWADVATTLVSARPKTRSPVDERSHRPADSRLQLDLDQLWTNGGKFDITPVTNELGRIAVHSHSFSLQNALLTIGKGLCVDKSLDQVVNCRDQVGVCGTACPLSDKCPYCRFALFVSCARSNIVYQPARVAVRLESLDSAGTETTDAHATTCVRMTFLLRPSTSLNDTAYRVFNSHLYLIGGVFRNAQRSGFSTEAAMTSMRATDRDGSLQAYLDKVVKEGIHDRMISRLRQAGVCCAPYPHQTASILVMLEMERRLEETGFGDAPRYGRRGISGFLDTAFVPLGSTHIMCSLTGACLRRDHAAKVVENARGGLLALPPGTGKTFTCVALSALTWTGSAYAAVIVPPAHLELQWRDEIRRFLPRARIVSDHDTYDLSAAPTFLVRSQAPNAHEVSIQPPVAVEGMRATRFIIDEAHGACVRYPERRPAPSEAIWAVTATPFFNRSSRAYSSLFDVLQRVPRHFGMPTIFAQIAKILRRDVGVVFRELVLNLHELDRILPPLTVSHERFTVSVTDERGRSLREAAASLGQGASRLMQRRIDETLMRVTSLGLALNYGELDPRRSHDDPRHLYANPRPAFPAWTSIADQAPGAVGASDDEDCVICLSGLAEDASVKLPCGHDFHHACLSNWHAQPIDSARCPMCRTGYSLADIRRRSGSNGSGTPAQAREQPRPQQRQWIFDEVHERATQLVQDHLAKDQGKAIVFLPQAAATRLIPHLRNAGITFVSCIDAAGPGRRASAIRDFVESTESVLLIDPLSFETGLNLTVANFVLSYPFHAGSADQMAGRVRRLGQEHPVSFVQMRVDSSALMIST